MAGSTCLVLWVQITRLELLLQEKGQLQRLLYRFVADPRWCSQILLGQQKEK